VLDRHALTHSVWRSSSNYSIRRIWVVRMVTFRVDAHETFVMRIAEIDS